MVKRIIVWTGTFCLLFATLANAQTAIDPSLLKDHWATSQECLAATGNRFYVPSILSQRKLGEKEEIRGIPMGTCVNMDLPDRMGGKGWVRVEAGRRFVYDKTTGKILRLAECNNDVYDVVPFSPIVGERGIQGIRGEVGPMGPQGLMGPQGPPGRDGRDGRDAFVPPVSVRDGFCGTKCKWALVTIGTAALAWGGYEVYDHRSHRSSAPIVVVQATVVIQ